MFSIHKNFNWIFLLGLVICIGSGVIFWGLAIKIGWQVYLLLKALTVAGAI